MSSWLHCEVDAAFFLLLAVFLDLEDATVSVPFPVEPVEDAVLLGVEVGGLSESRSPRESSSDVPFPDDNSCCLVGSVDPDFSFLFDETYNKENNCPFENRVLKEVHVTNAVGSKPTVYAYHDSK